MQQKYNQLDLFTGSLPAKPYCTDDLTTGLRIRCVDLALRQRYIQPNHPNSKLWLVYDIDRPTCVYELTDDLNLPAPHFFVQNPKNQHAHAFYGLETAVHLNLSSSQKAIRFAAAVDCAFTEKMDADGQYTGLIAKNPAHQHWRTYTVNCDSYELGELSEYVDLESYGDRRKSMPDTGLGRNVNLFNRLRRWSYKAIRQGWPDSAQWHRAVLDRAVGYNVADNPLPYGEVRNTAKSVAKWTYKHFTPEGFSQLQASRGSRKGKKRREELMPRVLEMVSQGVSQRAIADELGLTDRTVRNWLKDKSGKSHIR